MTTKYIIAIDGPAASGKSTTAKFLSQKLNYIYIDTGAMYRACALHALNNGINIDDKKSLNMMLKNIRINIKYKENGNIILLNEKDVTEEIRAEEVSKLASKIAKKHQIRTEMVRQQRELSKNGGVILDGRDIGTVVFPNAEIKIFMIADVYKRAERRWDELKTKKADISFDKILEELKWRDKNDSEREESPLKVAEDAIIIDTTEMSIEEQINEIEKIIREKNEINL